MFCVSWFCCSHNWYREKETHILLKEHLFAVYIADKFIILLIRMIKDEYLYWIKHFKYRLAVINVCPVLVSSELLLSTHLPVSEGWTAGLGVGSGLWFP